MYPLLRKFLFLFDPEKIHYFVANMLAFTLRIPGGKALFRSLYFVDDKRLEKNCWWHKV